jgi:hypothetical protein
LQQEKQRRPDENRQGEQQQRGTRTKHRNLAGSSLESAAMIQNKNLTAGHDPAQDSRSFSPKKTARPRPAKPCYFRITSSGR